MNMHEKGLKLKDQNEKCYIHEIELLDPVQWYEGEDSFISVFELLAAKERISARLLFKLGNYLGFRRIWRHLSAQLQEHTCKQTAGRWMK